MSDRLPTITEVGSQYGAPMGRWEGGYPESLTDRTVRVFKVPICSQGYDSGGAYWGIGAPLYCATDQEEYCRYIRAGSREEAIAKLGLPNRVLIVGIVNNPADQPSVPSVPVGKVTLRRSGRGFAVAAVDSSGKVLDVFDSLGNLSYARNIGERWAAEYSFPLCEQEGLERYA